MNHCTIARANESNPAWSAPWRTECEARYLLRLRSLDQRRAELAAPLRAQRRATLEVEMIRLHGARK
jgi:hypothetical protein